MGNKYSVKVWGRWDADAPERYSYMQTWGGESLLRGLWELRKARRMGFGCTVFEMR